MKQLSADQRAAVAAIAQRHGFSVDAARVMLDALAKGRGSMAQFDHPEFGGTGQWMRGGMTMVSDMFNDRLKARVAALCEDLAELAAQKWDTFTADEPWWPPDLGSPDSAGRRMTPGTRTSRASAALPSICTGRSRFTTRSTIESTAFPSSRGLTAPSRSPVSTGRSNSQVSR